MHGTQEDERLREMIGTWPTGWGEQQWADAARRLGTERTGMAVRQHWQLKLQAPYGAEPDGPPPDEPGGGPSGSAP